MKIERQKEFEMDWKMYITTRVKAAKCILQQQLRLENDLHSDETEAKQSIYYLAQCGKDIV